MDIKQNKNYCVVYKVASMLVCFIVLFSSLVVGSYADDTISESCLEVVQNSDSTPSVDNLSNYTKITSYTSDSSSLTSYYAWNISAGDVYVAFYKKNDYVYRAIFASSTQYNTVRVTYYYAYNGSFNSTTCTTNTYNDNYELYYDEYSTNLNPEVVSPNAQLYDTIDEALASIANQIVLDSASSYELNYNLPAGNALVVDITNLNPTVTMTMHTPTLNYAITSTQVHGVVSEVPNPIQTPISGTSSIFWQGAGKSDAFGRYDDWTASYTYSGITSGHNHAYLIIANPLSNTDTYFQNGTGMTANANPDISINVSSANNAKIYQFKETFSGTSLVSTQDGDTMSVTYDQSTGKWSTINDTTGEADSPVYGGMSQTDSFYNTVTDWLQNISNQISGFFTGAIGAVSNLVSAGSNFIQNLSGLYAWLPSPVLSVMSSALILVITIGVIKVFI